jgi:hypothetical protein
MDYPRKDMMGGDINIPVLVELWKSGSPAVDKDELITELLMASDEFRHLAEKQSP